MADIQPAETRSTVIPCMRYRNAPAAIEWLCDNFGFAKHLVVTEDDGVIAHAQLSFGNGLVMIGTVRESPLNRLMRQPDQIDGACTQSPYVIVQDIDVLHSKVKASGAEIIIDLQDESYGGRGFSCRDPEGHIWNFGTYDPWAAV